MTPTPMLRCAEYVSFIAAHPLQTVRTRDGHEWRLFDVGPGSSTWAGAAPPPREGGGGSAACGSAAATAAGAALPLVCVHGSSGTAHAFFMQCRGLAAQGHRCISVGWAAAFSHDEWCRSLSLLLDALGLRQVHMYGASLGGFLAQAFARVYPQRVRSLALTNSLCDTSAFHDAAGLFDGAYAYLPDFVLRGMVLDSFPPEEARDSLSAGEADAIDFQIAQLETLTQRELAARVTLNVTVGLSPFLRRRGALPGLPDERITFIDALDQHNIAREQREQLYAAHPDAKQALLRSGGDFPFLSRFDEVTLHLVVHLRRNSRAEGEEES